MVTSRFFVTQKVEGWSEISKLHDWFERQNAQWVFRGHSQWNWNLETTLERALPVLAPRSLARLTVEGSLLRRFKRQAHHYLTDLPPDDSWLQWLALMQHHGAPTRLLDWTYSFFVALHFAVERLATTSALWAVDSDWLRERSRAALGSDWAILDNDPNLATAETFVKLFARSGKRRLKFVTPVNPYRLNERLAIQQGLFLCPGDVSSTFEQNLSAILGGTAGRGKVLKIQISLNREARLDVLRRLYRMNVTRTSLFPGLDGFSQSLSWLMLYEKALVPDPKWPVQNTRPNRRLQPSAAGAMMSRRG